MVLLISHLDVNLVFVRSAVGTFPHFFVGHKSVIPLDVGPARLPGKHRAVGPAAGYANIAVERREGHASPRTSTRSVYSLDGGLLKFGDLDRGGAVDTTIRAAVDVCGQEDE